MARFYASVQGNRGQATRTGTKKSGINGHIRGWKVGAQVSVEDWAGQDQVSVRITGGSHGGPTAEIFRGTQKDYEKLLITGPDPMTGLSIDRSIDRSSNTQYGDIK
jgi:hypothetical protein